MFENRKSEELLNRIRSEMAAMDDDIPEPDWTEFRASVRDKLLSRSVQRTSEVRHWKLAWAFSLLALVGVTTSVLWNLKPGNQGPDPSLTNYAQQQVLEVSEWPQTGLFDDLVQLGDSEKAQLRQMLEAEQ
jgi:hypothetical protein